MLWSDRMDPFYVVSFSRPSDHSRIMRHLNWCNGFRVPNSVQIRNGNIQVFFSPFGIRYYINFTKIWNSYASMHVWIVLWSSGNDFRKWTGRPIYNCAYQMNADIILSCVSLTMQSIEINATEKTRNVDSAKKNIMLLIIMNGCVFFALHIFRYYLPLTHRYGGNWPALAVIYELRLRYVLFVSISIHHHHIMCVFCMFFKFMNKIYTPDHCVHCVRSSPWSSFYYSSSSLFMRFPIYRRRLNGKPLCLVDSMRYANVEQRPYCFCVRCISDHHVCCDCPYWLFNVIHIHHHVN